MTKLYMAVTPDEYELPMGFDVSAKVLARNFNLKANDIYHDITQARKQREEGKRVTVGEIRGVRFIKIVLDDE